MTSNRQIGIRRAALVATGALGLLAVAGGILAGPAFADTATESAAAVASRQTPLVAGTPCVTTAKACVDLEKQRAWLIKDGTVMRGPVAISSGGNGQETPIGHSLRVYRKEKDHKSQESRLPNGQPAPMPWAVFFEDGGIAFHGGSPNRSSAGCIHLAAADAQAWFEYLQIGDQVQVVRGSHELAARKAEATGGQAPEQGGNSGKDSGSGDDSDHQDDTSGDD
ncbi:MAG TPA: L,D-transpeptidase [Pseudonocardia sp.]|nr:L,D-transpeptidase [Pseudonocardia sp.]